MSNEPMAWQIRKIADDDYAVMDSFGKYVCEGIPIRELAEDIASLPIIKQALKQLETDLQQQAAQTQQITDHHGETLAEEHHDAQISAANSLIAILAELKAIRAAQGNTSSVELEENAKGAVQITVKTYVSSPPIDEACTEAVAAFAVLKREVERGQMAQWKDTLEAVQNGGGLT